MAGVSDDDARRMLADMSDIIDILERMYVDERLGYRERRVLNINIRQLKTWYIILFQLVADYLKMGDSK